MFIGSNTIGIYRCCNCTVAWITVPVVPSLLIMERKLLCFCVQGESSDIDESSSQEPMSPMSVASVEKNGSKEDNCLTVSLVVSELGEVQLHVSETCTVANAGGLMEIDSTQEGQVSETISRYNTLAMLNVLQ